MSNRLRTISIGRLSQGYLLPGILLLLSACSPARDSQQVQEAERVQEQTYTGTLTTTALQKSGR